mmetsp:Transcript_18725/g.27955  ORF Transcript_18725/g.27955 Transcript_18725/m.27955 type:complete len:207 (+) Transcript_18725:130-750(+)
MGLWIMCLYIYNRIIRLNIMPCLEMSTFLSQRTQLIKIGVTDNSRVNGRPFIPYAVFLILRNLFELFLEDRDKIFSNLQCFACDINSCNTCGFLSSRTLFTYSLLYCGIVRVLTEKVRHGTRISLLQCFHICLILFIRHRMTEQLLSIRIRYHTIRSITATTIRLNTHFLASLSLDSKFNLVKVRKLLSGWTGKSLHGGKLLVYSC